MQFPIGPRPPGPRLALFDLDRTLIDCNSGSLWVRAEWRDGRIGVSDVAWAWYWLVRYSLGLEAGLDGAVAWAAGRMAGLREVELADRVRSWFDREIRHRTRPGATAVLEQHRKAGDKLILATSTTSYAAQAAVDAFGLDGFVATRLRAVDGTLTGELAVNCVGSGKATAVADYAQAHGFDLASAAFYTDSATDLPLMERVGEPIAVHPDRALRGVAAARGWPIAAW